MPSAHLTLREEDVVRLCLEFLHNRDLHISQLSLERETGVINGSYTDDVLFLRQLVLDGQWDDVLEFIQPLEAIPAFDMKRFQFIVLRHKYVELLCIKSEASCSGTSVDSAVEEVVKVLTELERVAPTKEDYSNLCLLLTLPRLTDHLHYKDWNPSNARVKCFRDVYPLVDKFLLGDKKERSPVVSATARNDRLVQLIIKGILYESCVSYCQTKATGSKESQNHEMNFSKLLDGSVGFSDSDLSLLSWLQSIPHDTFSVPFEQRTLNVDVERIERPSLETSWTEHMLVTPIKPKTFPHSAMPFTRPRSAADIMSRSLLPALEGSPSFNRTNKALMALSTGDIVADSPMSRSSFASFHLTGHKNNKLMNTSVDRLFDNDGDVFLSSSYTEFQLPSISEQHSTPMGDRSSGTIKSKRDRSGSPADKRSNAGCVASNASTPEHRSSASTSTTARSSRRDSLSDVKPISTCTTLIASDSFNGDLLTQYQRHKQRFSENSLTREDNRFQDDSAVRGGGILNGGVAVRPAPAPTPNGTDGAGNRPPVNGDAHPHYDTIVKRTKMDPERRARPKDEDEDGLDPQFCQDMFHSSLGIAFVFVCSGMLGVLYGAGALDAVLPERERPRSRCLCCGLYTTTFVFGLFISASVRVERVGMLKKSAVLCCLLAIAHLFYTWHMVVFTEAGHVALIVVSGLGSAFMFYGGMVLWCYAEEVKALRKAGFVRGGRRMRGYEHEVSS